MNPKWISDQIALQFVCIYIHIWSLSHAISTELQIFWLLLWSNWNGSSQTREPDNHQQEKNARNQEVNISGRTAGNHASFNMLLIKHQIMWVSYIYMYINMFIFFIYRSVYLLICIFVYLSIYLILSYLILYYPIYLSIYRSIDRSIDLSIYRSIDLSIYRSIDLSIYLSICLSIYLSTYLCLYVSIYRFTFPGATLLHATSSTPLLLGP